MKTRADHRNRLVVGGVDLFERFDLVTEDGFDLGSPAPITDYAELIGGGFVDLTDWSGFTPYAAREMTFTLFRLCESECEWESVKTEVYRLLAGRRATFTCGADPGYTYTGRWIPDDAEYAGRIGQMRFKVHADPWKSKGIQTWRFSGAGGVEVILPCGRKPTNPVIEVKRPTLITLRERSWTLAPGTWRLRDMWLYDGDNLMVVNTRVDYSIQTWAQIKTKTWAEIADARLSDVAAAFRAIQTSPAWATLKGKTWSEMASMRWMELMHDATTSLDDEVYISYEIKEL